MNPICTIVLPGALTAVLIAIGGSLGPGHLYGYAAAALLFNFGSYFISDRLLLAIYRDREVEPAVNSRRELTDLHRELKCRL